MTPENRAKAYKEENEQLAQLRAQEEVTGFIRSSVTVNRTLCEDLIAEFAASMAKGNFNQISYKRAGISQGQFYSWMRKGKKDHDRFERGLEEKLSLEGQLMVVLGVAEGAIHTALLEDILSCDDPKLKLEFMRLRWPHLYSKNPSAHIDDDTGKEEKVSGFDVLVRKLSEYAMNNGLIPKDEKPDEDKGGG